MSGANNSTGSNSKDGLNEASKDEVFESKIYFQQHQLLNTASPTGMMNGTNTAPIDLTEDNDDDNDVTTPSEDDSEATDDEDDVIDLQSSGDESDNHTTPVEDTEMLTDEFEATDDDDNGSLEESDNVAELTIENDDVKDEPKKDVAMKNNEMRKNFNQSSANDSVQKSSTSSSLKNTFHAPDSVEIDSSDDELTLETDRAKLIQSLSFEKKSVTETVANENNRNEKSVESKTTTNNLKPVSVGIEIDSSDDELTMETDREQLIQSVLLEKNSAQNNISTQVQRANISIDSSDQHIKSPLRNSSSGSSQFYPNLENENEVVDKDDNNEGDTSEGGRNHCVEQPVESESSDRDNGGHNDATKHHDSTKPSPEYDSSDDEVACRMERPKVIEELRERKRQLAMRNESTAHESLNSLYDTTYDQNRKSTQTKTTMIQEMPKQRIRIVARKSSTQTKSPPQNPVNESDGKVQSHRDNNGFSCPNYFQDQDPSREYPDNLQFVNTWYSERMEENNDKVDPRQLSNGTSQISHPLSGEATQKSLRQSTKTQASKKRKERPNSPKSNVAALSTANKNDGGLRLRKASSAAKHVGRRQRRKKDKRDESDKTTIKQPTFLSPFRFGPTIAPVVREKLATDQQEVATSTGLVEQLSTNSSRDIDSTVKVFEQYEEAVTITKISRPRFSKTQTSNKVEPEFNDDASIVEHLSKKGLTADGLPFWSFATHLGEDDVLYYFKVFVQQSLVPGAGYGAFLQFIGAKRLCMRSKKLNEYILKNTCRSALEKNIPLQAVLDDGNTGVTVHFGDYGRNIRSEHDLVAKINQNDKPVDSVFRNGNQNVRIHIDGVSSSIDRKAYYVSDANRRIGRLGVHLESDYKWAPDEVFPVRPDAVIDLGRYGPFQAKDRIIEPLFSLKSFIFSLEPAEWGFDVDEKLDNELQIIDITDNSTGTPHDLAKRHIAMYVNEVGHNKALQQNVFNICEHDRVVKYFFKNQTPMKKGEIVELLTDYGKEYEGVRERKGYGWRNQHEGIEGDNVLWMRLHRNFLERKDVEELISDASLQRLSGHLNFISNEIWNPILNKVMSFVNNVSNTAPLMTTTQVIVIRRIMWIMHVCRQKLRTVLPEFPISNVTVLQNLFIHRMERTIQSMQLRANEMRLIQNFKIGDNEQSSYSHAILEEIVEEVTYYLQVKLPMVLNRAVYCDIACKLIIELCKIVATKCSFITTYDDINSISRLNVEIYREFLNAARIAAVQVRSSIDTISTPSSSSNLVFSSGLSVRSYFTASIADASKYFKMAPDFFLQNTTMSKGFQAALVEKMAYFDALISGTLEAHWDQCSSPLEIKESFLMTEFGGFQLPAEHGELRALGSVPRSGEFVKRIPVRVNETWYLVWQVFWPLHAFATTFLDQSVYSVDSVCRDLGIPVSLAQYAVENGIEQEASNKRDSFLDWCIPKTMFSSSFSQCQKKVKQATPKAGTKSTTSQSRPPAGLIYEGICTSFPNEISSAGWRQRIFKRQSGASRGQTDSYWYSPKFQLRLRSHLEIIRFVAALSRGLDEPEAWKHRLG